MRAFHRVSTAISSSLALCGATTLAIAQAPPSVVDPALGVRVAVSGLGQPTQIAFLSSNDFLVLEKATGKVQRVVSGVVHSTVLDLAVNSQGERGLLSIALHPDFPANPGVYLYWTESSTGLDTEDPAAVALLGNRVDRFLWNGSTLSFESNILRSRSFENDAAVPQIPFHDAGALRFAPGKANEKDKGKNNEKDKGKKHDKTTAKLFISLGDVGRRGFMQNNLQGPVPDDQFGGPEPDDAHLRGVVLRLNDDGSVPADNPFFRFGSTVPGFGANLQKLFAYGIRNSFGMDFEPHTGDLWMAENGDDSFSEINRVLPGHNGGWIQVMGPLRRIAQYKQIETTRPPGRLHQLRWPPTLIADSPIEALRRMYRLPGSHYANPEVQLEVRDAARGHGIHARKRPGQEVRGRPFRRHGGRERSTVQRAGRRAGGRRPVPAAARAQSPQLALR